MSPCFSDFFANTDKTHSCPPGWKYNYNSKSYDKGHDASDYSVYKVASEVQRRVDIDYFKGVTDAEYLKKIYGGTSRLSVADSQMMGMETQQAMTCPSIKKRKPLLPHKAQLLKYRIKYLKQKYPQLESFCQMHMLDVYPVDELYDILCKEVNKIKL